MGWKRKGGRFNGGKFNDFKLGKVVGEVGVVVVVVIDGLCGAGCGGGGVPP